MIARLSTSRRYRWSPARDAFYRVYRSHERSDLVDNILEQLDFHPLSITLLATVAHQGKWDTGTADPRMGRPPDGCTADGAQDEPGCHDRTLACSPMFRNLGPDARELLGVVAFFPQGVDKKNLEWLFPTISNTTAIFNTFGMLSLTYRSNEFITMLAPLRDYLRPKNPNSSPLLSKTKACYYTRMSVERQSPGPRICQCPMDHIRRCQR
jgi:hypothetical protein